MPHRYPQEAILRDGRRVLIRPFTGRDVDALYAFFQRLPIEYRRFAWDPIENRALIEQWGREIDYGKALPLLALDGTRIVADATLHRRKGGPLRLVGRIKWMLDPAFRRSFRQIQRAGVSPLLFPSAARPGVGSPLMSRNIWLSVTVSSGRTR